MQINLYSGGAADQRLSMEIYAQQMVALLEGSKAKSKHIQPLHHLNPSSVWAMRYLRYVRYPQQIKNHAADVHHVIDHGYAHLHGKFVGGASCITVHDLIPLLTYKGLIPGANLPKRPWLNQFSLSCVNRYDAVIAPSQSTANDLMEHLKLPPDQLHVIPPLIGDQFQAFGADQIDKFAEKYTLPSAPLWIMVSGREFYKNHSASLTVLKNLIDRGHQVRMLKTGLPAPAFTQQAVLLGVSDSVSEVMLEDSSELPLAYNFVDCLLFPSLYEGFGMPVAEALACGTPAVCSDRGSLKEIAPDLVPHIDPNDTDALTNAVIEVVEAWRANPDILPSAHDEVRPYRQDALQATWLTLYRSLTG